MARIFALSGEVGNDGFEIGRFGLGLTLYRAKVVFHQIDRFIVTTRHDRWCPSPNYALTRLHTIKEGRRSTGREPKPSFSTDVRGENIRYLSKHVRWHPNSTLSVRA